jgi:Skp family chaperone for outer membrane proteins
MIRMKFVSKVLLVLCTLSLASSAAFAGPNSFRKKHPRRAEVNARERNQEKRIHEGVKDGTMTKEEAKEARGNLRDIKKEERAEVKANGGHLTKAEQKDLNQQLNKNSREIHEEKHDGAAVPPPAAAPAAPTAQ